MPRALQIAALKGIQAWDRLRLRRLAARHPGLTIDPRASSNLACARYALEPGARLTIGPGVVTERRAGRLHFRVESGAAIEIGADAWLRTELGEVHLTAFAGARIELGPESFLNASSVSAKSAVRLGRRAFLGPGSRIFDSDQHDFDGERREESRPVALGDHVWVASDVTILKGVSIGAHTIVGARSLVTRDLPEHSLCYGSPAQAHGRVGDRSRAR